MSAKARAFGRWNFSRVRDRAGAKQIPGSCRGPRRAKPAVRHPAATETQGIGGDPCRNWKPYGARNSSPSADTRDTWRSLLSFGPATPPTDAKTVYGLAQA